MFGALVPSFNIGGKQYVKTVAGTCASLSILTLVLIFGLIKLENLLLRKNPFLNTNTETLDDGVSYSTSSEDFMMAFAA